MSTSQTLTWRRIISILVVVVLAYLIASVSLEDNPANDSPMRRLLRAFKPASAQVSHKPFNSAPFVRAASSTTTNTHLNHPTPAVKMGYDSKSLKDAIDSRRTFYQLTKQSTISDEKLREIVTHAIKHVPSAFNSQSARLVVLVKEDHDKFWQITTDILKAIVPADSWDHTAQRMNMFSGAYGTILFYEDPAPIKALQEKFPQYAEKFPQWSEHTSAMHQFALWTSLEAEGFGANLQHYNPLPNQKASETWNIPLEWDLKAQLVFGKPADDAKPMEKAFESVDKRVQFHGL